MDRTVWEMSRYQAQGENVPEADAAEPGAPTVDVPDETPSFLPLEGGAVLPPESPSEGCGVFPPESPRATAWLDDGPQGGLSTEPVAEAARRCRVLLQ